MNILRILSLGVLFAVHSGTTEAKAPAPVAIVYSLTGEAWLAISKQPLHLFERLPAGTTLEIGPGSRLALAFVSGLRYELGEGSRATLGARDLLARSGPVHALSRVPLLPRLSPIAAADHPGPRAGAVRIRTETISGLSPDGAVISLASAIRLRFDPVSASPNYHVQIVDRKGKLVLDIDTQATEVSVPSGVLAPGRTYLWSVETRARPGPVARGEATLVTLEASQARAREKLQRWVQRSGSADDLQLLEGVDRALGLWEGTRPIGDARCPFSEPGLVVETVTPESAAFRAGLMPGDRLFSWCRAPGGEGDCVAQGDLRTPFDWLDLQREHMPRGGVVVAGTRGAEDFHWNLLPTNPQGLTVAPLLHGALAEAYQSSREREQAGEPASAGEELERAAELADGNHCADAALWLRGRAAQLRAKARQWPAADAGFQAVVAKARALQADRAEMNLLMSWVETLMLRGEATQAKQQLERALSLEEKEHPESLGVATVLTQLGNVARDLQENLEEADSFYRRAHSLVLSAAPGSGAEAVTANNLSVSALERGDLAQAELHAARALAIREKLTPSGNAIVPNLVNYGTVLYARGDFAGAEAVLLRARKILGKIDPESVRMPGVLHNLGEISYQRGDYDAAENLFQRELALYEKVDPSGRLVWGSLIGLGEVALHRDQANKAAEWWQRALTISEKDNPRGPHTAWCLRGLATAVGMQGREAEAEKLLRQALAIWQEINQDAVDTAAVHLDLGALLLKQGNAGTAEDHLRAAIRIREKNGLLLPEAYHLLARLQARNGQAKEAVATYLAAVEALEAQRTRLGGAQESQWLYGSSLGDLYFEAAGHQITLKRPQEAWKFIERGRARGFHNLLTQRDLRFAGELPAELYAERRRLAAEYDRVQTALADWVPEQGSQKMEELQGRLRDLRLEQAEIQKRIQQSSPRLGAIESPAPLDLSAARSALDPGTVLLTYSVGVARSFLFVIEAAGAPGPGFSFYPLAIGKEDLNQEVEAFRSLLGRPDTDLSALKQRGRHLYDLLVRPAKPVLAKADRLLISPDGPLHSLPFAALVSGDRYLAELKPIHIAASAAVYREIRATRSKKPSATMELLAVGDPHYLPAETATEPQVQAALRRGFKLEPLPATRSEVNAISGLFPGARTLLGRDATEETIKSLAPQARRLHFACHGLLDERFPLNSALALSIPEHPEEGRDNGLLQAWEIFESVRLDADLVTLSACDSGLGKEMGGEGLVGLVRAFQFAGARSVLASLWSVSDVSTADLMKRFYGYLREGRSKDEALRAAQTDLIRSPDFSHPYYWAAFQLTGDWR